MANDRPQKELVAQTYASTIERKLTPTLNNLDKSNPKVEPQKSRNDWFDEGCQKIMDWEDDADRYYELLKLKKNNLKKNYTTEQ